MKLTKAKQRKRDRQTLKSFIIDSGATSHYVRPADELPVVGPSNKNIYVATGQAIKSTAQVLLPFDKVKQSARIAELVPHLKQNSLVSVGKLADAGYTTVFLPHNEGVRVLDNDDNGRMNGEPVIQGWREENGSRLWRISTVATDVASDDGFFSVRCGCTV